MIAAATGANTAVVELFAFFHDSCRVNEYTDHDHGKRGADLALKLQGRMFDASADEMNLLVEACTGHSDGHTEADITVQTCWDADRLDLVTLESAPEPLDPRVQLRLVPASQWAAIRYSGTWSQSNYEEHLALLKDALDKAGVATQGEPVLARYNPPFTPWFMRRNEIWLALR